jgi:hypothetical protein
VIVQPKTHLGRSATLLREHAATLESLGLTPEVDRENLETVMDVPCKAEDGLMIECEAVGPKSARGRTVYVHVPAEQVVALLRLTRQSAAAQRSTPLAAPAPAPE